MVFEVIMIAVPLWSTVFWLIEIESRIRELGKKHD